MEKCLYEIDHGLKTFLGPSVEVVREPFSILIVQELHLSGIVFLMYIIFNLYTNLPGMYYFSGEETSSDSFGDVPIPIVKKPVHQELECELNLLGKLVLPSWLPCCSQ